MSGKRIGVVIGTSPRENLEATEALRLCVGLTLRIHDIYLILMGDGLEALACRPMEKAQEPDFRKHITTFAELGLPLIVEQESMETRRDLCMDLNPELWSRDEIFRLLTQCDGVIMVRKKPVGSNGCNAMIC